MSTRGHRSGRFRFAGTRIGGLMLAGPLVGLMSVPALAGPEGEQVVHGYAQFTRNGANTIIRTGNRTIINYTGFDLTRHESVRFIQAGANARVLNRIQSDAPTFIDGSIRANGNVYFVNNAGIVFGQNAVINVGGLFAAAGNISNRDFIDGRDRFTDLSGEVVNNGRIEAGSVGLVGHRVSNYGSIVAPEGLVTMAAGDEVYIGERNGHVFARISASQETADGGGLVQAGSIESRGTMLSVGDHFALAVLDSSSIRAERLTVKGGREGSEVTVAGDIDATSADGVGGRVDVFGDRVRVDGATIDASGRLGGGVIRIGGDYQGGGKSPTSNTTLVMSDTLLKADALLAGRGGRVIVWADGFTGFAGYISARGGALNGDGGFVEVSGKETLAYRGLTDVRAVNGRSGTLLLDPRIIEIVDGAAGDWPGDDGDDIQFEDAPVTITITEGDLINQLNLLGDGELLLQASRDIRIENGVRVEFGAGESFSGLLTLEAGRRIQFLGNARLDLDTGSLRLIANSDGFTAGGVMTRGAGNGDINMSANSSILTDGGTIELFLQDFGDSSNIFVSTINAGATGTVRLSHTGTQGASNHHIEQVAGGDGIRAATVEISSIDGGRVGLDTGSRLLLAADNLSISTAGGNMFLDLTGGTAIDSLTTGGGDLDLLANSTVNLAGDVDADGGDAIVVAGQIITSGGSLSASNVSLEATTGRIGSGGDRVAVTADLIAARAQEGVFLETEAAGGGGLVIGDFNGLSGITSTTGTIELIHDGDLTLDAELVATGHGLAEDVIRVDASAVTINAGGGADAGATGGIVFNTDSFLIDGDMGMAGREVTLNVGAGGVTVNAVFGGAFEEVTIDTTGELAINAGGRLETTGSLTTTADSYDILGGDGLNGDDALTVRALNGLDADTGFLGELETAGTLTLSALGGDLSLGGQAAVFAAANDVVLDATGQIALGGADPTAYQFNAVSITAGGGIDFGAGVTGLTSAGGLLLDAGDGEIVNIQNANLFTLTSGAAGTTLNSSVTAAGSLRFVGGVDATGFDGFPTLGEPTLVFDIGGSLAFDDGLNATGRSVEIIAQDGTLGGALFAVTLLIRNAEISVGDDNGGFWVSNAFLDQTIVSTLLLGTELFETQQVWLDNISTTFTGNLLVHSEFIDAVNNDSAIDNLDLTAGNRILIDRVRLETTGGDLRLEGEDNGIVMIGDAGADALVGATGGVIGLFSDVTGTGNAIFDGVLRIDGVGTRSILRDAGDLGTLRFVEDVMAGGGQGLLIDAADGAISFGTGIVGQGGAFASIDLAGGGGILADTSLVLVSDGSVITRNDVTAGGRIDIIVDADGTADGTDTGTFAGLNSDAAGNAGITITNGLADLGNTTLTFNGLLRAAGATNDGIIVNAGTGTVDLLGGIESNGGLFLSRASLTTLSSNIVTGGGSVTISDGLLVNGARTVTTLDGLFAVGGVTVLDNTFEVNTVGVGGGAVTFGDAVIGTGPGVGSLRINAGTGDVTFDGSVGRTAEDRHLALFEITDANQVFFRGGIYEAVTMTLNAGSLRIDPSGGGETEFVSRGGTMDFLGSFSLAAGNDLRLTALEGGDVTVSGVVADADNTSTLTARINDDISFAALGGALTRLALVDVEANRAEVTGAAFADRFVFRADVIEFTGGPDSITGREMTLVQRDPSLGINLGGDGSDATRLNITATHLLALTDGFEVVRVGDDETQDLRVMGNPGDLPLDIRDPFELRSETSVSFLGDVLGTGDAALRVFSGAATLLTGDITLAGGSLIFTDLLGDSGQVVIRDTVNLITGGGEVLLGSVDGDPGTTNTLFIDADTGAVRVGSVGMTEALADFTLLGGAVELGQIGTGGKAGVEGTTLVEAETTLTFLDTIYNTNGARYSARLGMSADNDLRFITNDADIAFGSTLQRGRGSITLSDGSDWRVTAGEGTIGLDGDYIGSDSNMFLTGARIVLNGNTTFTNPGGFVDFVGLLQGRKNLDMAVADGRVRFREVGSNTVAADRLRDVDIASGRIDFMGARFDADSARFEADLYELLPESALPITTVVTHQGDLEFDGGELRFRRGQLSLIALDGAVSVTQIRGSADANFLGVRASTIVTLAGIGTSNGSGVQDMVIRGNDIDFEGDLFVRGRTLLRPLDEGVRIRVGSNLVLGNNALEISEEMLARFVSTIATSTLNVGGFAEIDDLESDLAAGSFSNSRIDIRDISIDRQISFFGADIELFNGSTLSMTDGAGVRLSSVGVSRLNGTIVSEGGVIVVNGDRAILNGLVDSNGGDIFIRSENAFVDEDAEFTTLGGPGDGDFIVDGGVDGLVAGTGDFVLNVGRGDIRLATGAGFGQTRRLRSVDLTANALRLTNVRTTGDQNFTSPGLSVGTGRLDSLNGNIRFNSDVRVVGDHTVRVRDGRIFLGNIIGSEGNKPGRQALTLETAEGGSVEFRGDTSFVDALIVDGTTTVFGDRSFQGGEIRFLGSIDSNTGQVDLRVDADDTAQLGGTVGRRERFRTVSVSGDEIILGGTSDGIRIDTSGLQEYEGDVRIAGDVFLQAHGFNGQAARQDSVLFLGDINGTAAGADTLTVIVDRTGGFSEDGTFPPTNVPIIGFNGDIGAGTALEALNLNYVEDSIDGRIDGDGNAFGSMVATVVFGDVDEYMGPNGTTRDFQIHATEFNMGRGEALTVLGGASFFGDRARVSDISTLNDMELRFTENITILNRLPKQTFDTITEQPTDDEGVDFVAGGGIDFITNDLEIDNEGLVAPGIVAFAAAGGEVGFGSGRLASGAQVRSLPENTDDLFVVEFSQLPRGDGEVVLSETFMVLDVRSDGPSNTNIAEAIAGAVQNADSGRVESGTVVEATVRDILVELGLEPRGYAIDYPENAEAREVVTETMLASLDGSGLFVDVANIDGRGGIETTIDRLDRGVTTEVVTLYMLLWYGPRDESGQLLPPSEDAPTGGLVPYEREIQSEAIKAAFQKVTDDCRLWLESHDPEAAEAREVPADHWMNFLIERSEQYPAASQYVVEYERLMQGLREMGLSQDELRRVWEFRLRLALPREMDHEGFRQLLTGERELEVAANAEFNGREPVIEME